ncbi:S8 family peptidase [Paenibacillus sediminis]|uniref:Subtilisin family serine protease n=1 Tax=Paenibacillus sediminis TaxID=664909 RepID=A0ABS4H802_9BACL|nr:subtilisin family serine protease [Paenibacillus sediminis]
MDYSNFLQLLHNEIESPINKRRQRIITFVHPRQYAECLYYLRKLKPSLSKLQHVQSSNLIQALICPLSSDGIIDQIMDQFRDTLIIEEDVQMRVHDVQSPKYEIPQSIPWGVKQIRAPQTWSTSTGYQVKIGVIDTGVDFNHPDLRNSLARGINLINRTMLPYDDNGHGTHISGTIAAANSTQGMIGIAPRATIYPVKAFDYNGSAFVSDIILGIEWCVRNQVNIINMSFGMKTRSRALLDVVKKAYHAGIVIVASSGNDRKKYSIDYPARYPQTISVGATDKYRRIASFSNRGPFVDIYAPGDKIISCWNHSKYNEMSGTSMATSHVSGAIALLLAQRPGLTPAEIKNLLLRSASSLKSKNDWRRVSEGKAGEVNALRLMRDGLKKYANSKKTAPSFE